MSCSWDERLRGRVPQCFFDLARRAVHARVDLSGRGARTSGSTSKSGEGQRSTSMICSFARSSFEDHPEVMSRTSRDIASFWSRVSGHEQFAAKVDWQLALGRDRREARTCSSSAIASSHLRLQRRGRRCVSRDDRIDRSTERLECAAQPELPQSALADPLLQLFVRASLRTQPNWRTILTSLVMSRTKPASPRVTTMRHRRLSSCSLT